MLIIVCTFQAIIYLLNVSIKLCIGIMTLYYGLILYREFATEQGKHASSSSAQRGHEGPKAGTGQKAQSENKPAKSAYGGARPKTTPKYRTNKVLENKLAIMKSCKPKME